MSSAVENVAVSRTASRAGHDGVLERVGGASVLATAVALVAVAAAVDTSGARPFTTLRWAVISTAVCAGAAAVRRWSLPRWHLAAWGIVVGFMIVGAITGPDSTTAWLGHPQRHLGVFAWIVFALATALGGHLIGRRRAASAIELAVVVIAGNIVATSAVDALGWDPAGSSFDGGRIGGVFGQPVVLATVAVLLLPPVVAARRVGPIRWAVAAGLAGTIALTQTRGAVVGVVAIVVVSTPTWTRRLRGVSSTSRSRIAIAAAVVAVGLAALTPFGSRLIDSASSSRVDEWALGVEVLADNPLTGVGPEGYRIAVLEHFDDAYVADYGRDVIVDRAHSSPLDVAVSGGVLAAVAYVALIGSVAVATWRRQRAGMDDAIDRFAVAAGLGAVGAFAAGLVAFPVPEIDVVAWLFAGMALSQGRPSGDEPLRRRVGIVVAVAAVGAASIAGVAGFTDVLADRHMGDATTAAASGRTSAAVASAERAVDRRGDLVDAHWLAATVAATGPTILDLDRAITATETGLDRFPRDPALRDLHAGLLVERALRSGLVADVDAAEAALADLQRSDPTSFVVESGTQRLTDACLIRCDNRP